MFITKNKNFFLGLAFLLTVVALGFIGVYGLNEGIDFKGGSLMAVSYGSASSTPATTASTTPVAVSVRPSIDEINKAVAALDFGNVVVQPIGDNGVTVKTRSLVEAERIELLSALSLGGKMPVEQTQFTSIGPVVGQELKVKSIYAVALVILLIVLYITFAFRKVSTPVASWKYGVIAIITLVHDIIIPTGFYALYGHYTGAEVDVLFVTAILAILGFSIHDTIVVFDRVRENLRSRDPKKESFADTVGNSLSQTFTRSINTSLTVIFTLFVLYFLGGVSTENFALLLLVGVTAGTYSSLFFASPLLVLFESWQKK
jgi:preprotein translocase subunit SecF